MTYLETEIERIVLIDVFKFEERERDQQFVVSQPLKIFLDTKSIPTDIYFPGDRGAFINLLEELAHESGNGLILQLSGHGDPAMTGFGNDLNSYWMLWEEMLPYFTEINRAKDGRLIINASMICFSDGLINTTNKNYKPYYAAITSCDKRSYQGLRQNIMWFESSLKGQNTIKAIMDSNNGLEANLDYKPYKVDFHRVYS
jgi:hypothetical protein